MRVQCIFTRWSGDFSTFFRYLIWAIFLRIHRSTADTVAAAAAAARARDEAALWGATDLTTSSAGANASTSSGGGGGGSSANAGGIGDIKRRRLVVDLLAPAASKAVPTKVWLPEPTVLALKLN